MNHAEQVMISLHLVAEQARLLAHINQIRTSGEVAPAYCWLTQTSMTKGTRTYTYAILVTQPPDRKPRSQSLGRPGSARHRQWQQAIARREAIVELEQQLTLLQVLIDRQTKQSPNLGLD